MQALLVLIALLIILFNVIINLTNITAIIKYCFKHNTLNRFWPSYYKGCVSGRAIYSTILSFIFAVVLFIILTPIIVIRGIVKKDEIMQRRKSGAYFDYSNISLNRPELFRTNLSSIRLNNITITSSRSFSIDYTKVVSELTRQAKNEYTLSCDSMQEIVVNNEIVTVPLLLTVNAMSYPVYFIYTPFHKEQYINISNTLRKNGIDQTVYFSVLPL